MDWTDLIEAGFDILGNGSNDARAAAVRSVEAAVEPGEQPVAATAGRHPDHFRKGVLVLTTHRLLFLKDGKPPLPVALAAVTDVTVTKSRLNGEILRVVALTGAHRFEEVAKAEVFAEQLRRAAADARRAAAEPAAPAPAVDLLDQLERLAALHAGGALTAEEFSRAKQRLIG
ncbi:SHOCT domain-containing protein [Kitasatospora sp. NBC_00374]|uniref:SHOCT domain-containing protein n=1 Tax=Kitasatospora sp. NBC_00374 TaxID=2975964 RepID=UPI0030DF4DCE